MAKKSKQSWFHPNQILNPFAEGKGWLRTLGELSAYGLSIPGVYKDGGRVRGVGKAKRGFGRAMRKK